MLIPTIMRKSLRNLIALLCGVFISFDVAHAQSDQYVYAMTSLFKDGTDWIALRRLNTQMGEFTSLLTNGTLSKNPGLYDAATQNMVVDFSSDTISNSYPQLAFGSGVAAIALDKEGNRLYFTPTSVDQLRYVDLTTMKTYCITGQSFAKAGNLLFHTGTINRMVIAPDGFGYTLTNDGNHLFRFNTSGNTTITDLGELADVPVSNETIHSECSNGGGDLVADDSGNLILVTASNKIFTININSRQALFLGNISGLPQKFTTNGAAVDEGGNLIVSSSMYSDGYFLVDAKTWTASPYKNLNENYNTSDLANSNVLLTKTSALIRQPNSNKIKVFPNPVVTDAFNIQFNNLKPGNYTVQLTDALGSPVHQQSVNLLGAQQTESVNISGRNAQGFYFLKILDESYQLVFSQIVLVGR